MAVGVENTATGSSASAGGASSGSASLTVTSANALIVVIVTQGNNVSTPVVTWDSGGTNQTMTLIGTFSGAIYIYGLLAPTTGTRTLAWSWSGNSDYALGAAGLTGVTQTSLVAAFANFTTSSGTSTSPSVAVSTASGNAVFGGALDTDASAATGISGVTLITSFNVANGGNEVVNYVDPALGALATLSYTINSASWFYAGVNVVAAGAAPPAGTQLLALNAGLRMM